MERTPSNFNIVKVSEKKKIIIIIPGHQRDHRNSIFNARTHKRNPYSLWIPRKKKEEKRKTENLDDEWKNRKDSNRWSDAKD